MNEIPDSPPQVTMTSMLDAEPALSLRLAKNERDLQAAQRLRYEVFVEELGARGAGVDHAARLEKDEFDPHFDHLLLIDNRRDPALLQDVVGAYRLLPPERVATAGGYYSESEFDLSELKASGRRLLELGRSCVHRDMRGGAAMFLLWNGLADYVLERGIEVMFGAASFHGTDREALAKPLSHLYHFHRAPKGLRVVALPAHRMDMNILPPDQVNRAEAMAGIPALIKAYLRMGGYVSDGAWLDEAFNTTDVCLVVDTAQMSMKHRDFYVRKKGRDV
jgi:L-ornithine Nalpha-acyltransferase